MPHLIKPGNRMEEGGVAGTATVSFTDDFGTLLRIESYKMINAEQKAARESSFGVPIAAPAFTIS